MKVTTIFLTGSILARTLVAFQSNWSKKAFLKCNLSAGNLHYKVPESSCRLAALNLSKDENEIDGRSARKTPEQAYPWTHIENFRNMFGAFVVATLISVGSLTVAPNDAAASDGAAIGLCLLQQCKGALAKCITNPNCLANVICINTCNGKEDETGCQIKCGDIFENTVVGEFNKCAVSDRNCVPQRQDDGSYPVPPKENTVEKFDTSLWNGRWYITAGQNELFDIFPCQVHFFTETAPGKFFGKLNWRIEEPDGEFFTRDALQRFVQDSDWPAHLINHDNEYLHYEDDWYVLDYATDDNKEGLPPFCFVYYRGSNDAWVGYGGAFVYTRDSKLPEAIKPRLREAAKRVNFDFDKDFSETDNTCSTLEKGEAILKREQFAGKVIIQTENQFAQQAVLARSTAVNSIKAQKLFFDNELDQAEKAFESIGKSVTNFEEAALKTIEGEEKAVLKAIEGTEEAALKAIEGSVPKLRK